MITDTMKSSTIVALLASMIAVCSAVDKCYVCEYTELGGQTTGDSTCQQPPITMAGEDCLGQNNKCAKYYFKSKDMVYVKRFCMPICMEGETSIPMGGQTVDIAIVCCDDGDMCNHATLVTMTTAKIAAITLMGLIVIFINM